MEVCSNESRSPSSTCSEPIDDNSSTRPHNLDPADKPSSASFRHPHSRLSTRRTSTSHPSTKEVGNRYIIMELPQSGLLSSPFSLANGYSPQSSHPGWQQSIPVHQAAAPRSLVSSNWRGSQTPADPMSSMPPGLSNYSLTSSSASPAALSRERHVSISDCLNGYAYCIQRPDGRYTRLVPADMLPALSEIQAKQSSAQGMVLLPDLHMQPPQGVAKMNQPVTVKAPSAPASENLQANKTPETRIDRIVATSPAQQRRNKIYCDKWIHDGTCAFTQQGCKYKHEMPFDKATQHSLGLFHGFPKWWKDLQEDLQKRQQKDAPVSRTQPLGQQDWKAEGSDKTPQAPIGAERLQQVGAVRANDSQNRCIWGPIEPPQRTGSESAPGSVITPSALKRWTNSGESSSSRSSADSIIRSPID
ncbi:hypothetical protein FZEAL_7927 [Fusarium zealandicum]|uniref:C3H1-type domain-containing protein n=1 Tax=Fusarium zealandicum TaxID=1053134 RepID=A0A8H4UEW5_9HYPO|nr:hypothetical protein FZEAL_7927 [Fusarium zealandicum]